MKFAPLFLLIAGAAFGQSLLLDDFTAGPYKDTLKLGDPSDLKLKPLPSGSPAGPARYTIFSVGTLNPVDYQQPNHLEIGHGYLIIDNGFGAIPGLQLAYGYNLDGTPYSLHLNLSAYDRFRLRFAGGGAFYALTIYTADGRHFGTSGSTPVSGSPFNFDIPFSAFVGFDFHDVQAIVFSFEAVSVPFGIDSFEVRARS